jgi:acetyl/propionyl-CoA carboxylase alpha subunit
VERGERESHAGLEDRKGQRPLGGSLESSQHPLLITPRVDTALGKGYEVTLHYEPLLAKVMAWGENREEDRKELLRALLAFRLEGVKCNIPFLRDILGTPEFCLLLTSARPRDFG